MFKLPFWKKTEPPKNLLKKEGFSGKNKFLKEGVDGTERPRGKKKELPKPWTTKDRIIVAFALLLTFALGIYFWYKGAGKLPEFNFGSFRLPSFEEKIILQ